MDKDLESLIRENDELKKRVLELEEENNYLWHMLEEKQNSENAVGQAIESMLQEVLEEQMLKNMKPIGDA
jgi:cell division septum initiation protein DivIVA